MPVTSPDLRARRERLGVSRFNLAGRSNVSPGWLQALEHGLRPVHGSPALARVEAALDQLEAEREQLGDAWELAPGVGRSGFRDDRDGPGAA